jgi:dihydroorotate dehydrogenase
VRPDHGAYQRVVRPLGFRLPAESAHDLSKRLLRIAPPGASRVDPVDHDPRLASRLGGLALRNPVGLAAGFDKNAEVVPALTRLGFGYVTVGSILSQPRSGNAKPRIARDAPARALVNAMGLPSAGAESVARRLRRMHAGSMRRRPVAPVVANIQGFGVDDYLRCLTLVEPWVDAIELTVICPNVYDRGFDALDPATFERIVKAVNGARHKPLFVKLPSPEPDAEIARPLSASIELACVAERLGVDALTLAGSYRRVAPELAAGRGNVSGRPALPRGLAFVRELHAATGGRVAIKALGGITSGADAYAAIAAGASSVELFTALVYEGPGVCRAINRELLRTMDAAGVRSVTELRGSGT